MELIPQAPKGTFLRGNLELTSFSYKAKKLELPQKVELWKS